MIENGSIKEGRKASRFVEKYSCDNIVDEFEEVLKEVARGGGKYTGSRNTERQVIKRDGFI